ncbi:hypothetical protein [Micromonospora echinospora]|uniref:hypothetical protein n=1 Tax=Micromonospora echinospora TaxID=1877 RepID=UPI003A85BED9
MAVIVGARIPWAGRPSANPEETSRFRLVIASSRAHSMPEFLMLSAKVNSVATEKWCIVVPTASDGACAPIARMTRTASSGVAPSPP